MKTKRKTRWDGLLLVGFPLTFFVFFSFIIARKAAVDYFRPQVAQAHYESQQHFPT